MRQLCKGNVAIVKAAILAGCRQYYGYPITPASEVAEAAALYLPQVGGTFLQAESEVAAINMVYGAAATVARVMTASSGPGLSLMQEGISYLAGAELPCVIVDVVRAGPGLRTLHLSRRLFLSCERRRPRQLSEYRPRAGIRSGNGGPHDSRVRSRGPLSQPGHHHGGRLHWADDGAGRTERPKSPCPKNPGPLKEPQIAARTSPVRSIWSWTISKRTS